VTAKGLIASPIVALFGFILAGVTAQALGADSIANEAGWIFGIAIWTAYVAVLLFGARAVRGWLRSAFPRGRGDATTDR
jgi:hypothetical protein